VAPPTGTIEINGGAATTTSASVTLTLSATSGSGAITQMQFSKDGGTTWYGWEPYVTTRTVTLMPSSPGTRSIWVRYKDSAGGVSPAYSDSIEVL